MSLFRGRKSVREEGELGGRETEQTFFVHKKFSPKFALFSFTCSFSSPAWFHLHATFESGKELRSPQSSESELAGQQALLFRWY
jgi:hypothetical protein